MTLKKEERKGYEYMRMVRVTRLVNTTIIFTSKKFQIYAGFSGI